MRKRLRQRQQHLRRKPSRGLGQRHVRPRRRIPRPGEQRNFSRARLQRNFSRAAAPPQQFHALILAASAPAPPSSGAFCRNDARRTLRRQPFCAAVHL